MGGSDDPPPRTAPPGGPASGQDCPARLNTVIVGPVAGITKGNWLDVRVDRSGSQSRVVLVDEVTGATVGSLAGVPNLAILIRCLEAGVTYRAIVDDVSGGRIDITVLQG